ncbi:hypothetical protein SB759_41010, partial [Pseudomonas sp. SIMBA_059]
AKLTATPLDVLEEYGLGEPTTPAIPAMAHSGSSPDNAEAAGTAGQRAGESAAITDCGVPATASAEIEDTPDTPAERS